MKRVSSAGLPARQLKVFDFTNCEPESYLAPDVEQVLADQAREELQLTLAEITRQGFIGMEA